MNGPFDIPKAQGGVTVGDASGLEGAQDLFRSLRERLEIGGPLGQPGLGGQTIDLGDVLQREQASALGTFQRAPGTLLQSGAGGPVFEVDETGRLRGYTSSDVFSKSGRKFSDVQFLSPEQIARFERGADISTPFSLPTGSSGGALGAPLSTIRGFSEIPGLSASEASRLANLIGFLPAPQKVGGQFNRLLPAEQTALISAWRLAGIPEADVRAMIERTGIRGRARTGVFTG